MRQGPTVFVTVAYCCCSSASTATAFSLAPRNVVRCAVGSRGQGVGFQQPDSGSLVGLAMTDESSSVQTEESSSVVADAAVVETPQALVEAPPPSLPTMDASTAVSPVLDQLDSFAVEQKRDDDDGEQDTYRRGLATVGFITLLFASYSPTVHFALTFSSSVMPPPPVLLFNAVICTVALGGLVFAGPTLDAAVPLPCTLEENNRNDDDDEEEKDAPLDSQSLLAGVELGTYKSLGTAANLFGLSLTTADHGAFLVQLTTLIVPLVQGIRGVPIPSQIWTAVGLALTGVGLFTLEGSGGGSSASSSALASQWQGDALCVLAAAFYATYDLRLFEWGKRVAPLRLITSKVVTQAVLSIVLLLVAGSAEARDYLATIRGMSTMDWSSTTFAPLVAVCLWCGLVVNALAPFLQVGGQQAVGAARAQVVYASQPLWAALLSFVALGETVGPQGLTGGALFLIAMGLAATAEAPRPDCGQDDCEV